MVTVHFAHAMKIPACLGIVFLQSISAPPGRAAGLNDHLAPLARYLGEWTWQWKDEHGEEQTSSSTVRADKSGAFIVDRSDDGSEFNIYYWHPLSKTIASSGFTSDGDRGWSILTCRGAHWLEQSSGVDAQGKFRTHIDQWEWSSSDAGTYQETHSFRDGISEPDDFRLSFQRSQGPAKQPSGPGLPPELKEHLQPIAPLIGNWQSESSGSAGQARTSRMRVIAEAGGHAMVQRIENLSGTQVVSSSITVFYWQRESGCLASIRIDSGGSVAMAQIFPRGGRWLSQCCGWNEEGKLQSALCVFDWKGDGTLSISESASFEKGEPRTAVSTMTYLRSK